MVRRLSEDRIPVPAEREQPVLEAACAVRYAERAVDDRLLVSGLPVVEGRSAGQEICAVLVSRVLVGRDQWFCCGRWGAPFLASGGPPAELLLARLQGSLPNHAAACVRIVHRGSAAVASAAGYVLATQDSTQRLISIATVGDGAIADGELLEALNMVGSSSAPVLIVIERNLYAGSADAREVSRADLQQLANAFRIAYSDCSQYDPEQCERTLQHAARWVRAERKPMMVAVDCYLLDGQKSSGAVAETSERAAYADLDPVSRYEHDLPDHAARLRTLARDLVDAVVYPRDITAEAQPGESLEGQPPLFVVPAGQFVNSAFGESVCVCIPGGTLALTRAACGAALSGRRVRVYLPRWETTTPAKLANMWATERALLLPRLGLRRTMVQLVGEETVVMRDDENDRITPIAGRKRAEVHNLQAGMQNALPVTIITACRTNGLREAATRQPALCGSILPVIIYECSRLLVLFPEMNAVADVDAIRFHGSINIGVAMDAGNGLRVPVFQRADKLSLTEIALELREVAVLYLDQRLTTTRLAGATFTISDLGNEGVQSFTPLISAGQSAILGVGAEELTGGRGSLHLSLTFDHRVSSGREAARFLAALRDRLEAYDMALHGARSAPAVEPACTMCYRSAAELHGIGAHLVATVHADGSPRNVCTVCLMGA